jgi:probable HAF family extracellular repeat protein
MTDLGTLGGLFSAAYAINDSGQVAGYADTADRGSRHGFLWGAGVMTDVGTLGGRNSYAQAVSAYGQVVGYADTADGLPHAFFWDNDGMTDLGTLGGPYSFAQAINASGQVARYASTAVSGVQHAFLWSDGAMTDLGTLSGYTRSIALGMNASAQVVGYVFTPDSGRASHAFVCTDGMMADLNDLIPADSGWTLLQAEAISDNGQSWGTGFTAAKPARSS